MVLDRDDDWVRRLLDMSKASMASTLKAYSLTMLMTSLNGQHARRRERMGRKEEYIYTFAKCPSSTMSEQSQQSRKRTIAPERNLAGEGVAVVHDRLALGPVPAVDLNTAAALLERLHVCLHRRGALRVNMVRGKVNMIGEVFLGEQP